MENSLDGKALSAQVLKTLVADGTPTGHHLVYLPAGLGTPSSNQELANAVASLANAHGGLVVLGVETDGDRPRKLAGLGSGDPEKGREEARRILTERIHPTVDVNVTVVRIAGGGHTLVIEVPPSLDAPHHVDGVYPQRSGRETVVMTAAEIDRVRAQRRKVLEGFRARARELADAAQHNRIVPVRAGAVGLYLYVASTPLALWGREVDLGAANEGLPALNAFSESAEGALGLRCTPYGAIGVRPAANNANAAEELAYLTRQGEMLHGLPDARSIKTEGGNRLCLDVVKFQDTLLDVLPRNLMHLEGLGFVPPFYAVLVGAGEGTHLHLGTERICRAEYHPKELIIDALLHLEDLRAAMPPDKPEVGSGVSQDAAARSIRPLLDRLYQAAGFAGSREGS